MSRAVEVAARAHGMSLEAYQAEVCPVLFVLFERWDSSTALERVTELAYLALGTVGDVETTYARRRRVQDWVHGVQDPAWLEAAGLDREAQALRALRPVMEAERPTWEAVRGRRARSERVMTTIQGAREAASKAYEAALQETYAVVPEDEQGHVFTASLEAIGEAGPVRSCVWDIGRFAALALVVRAAMTAAPSPGGVLYEPAMRAVLKPVTRALEPALVALLEDLLAASSGVVSSYSKKVLDGALRVTYLSSR